MLTLPVLEAALYFSLPVTLFVAAIASSLAVFWVAYVAHFTPPFSIGELLEATTLVLALLPAGTLVNWLITLLGNRDQELHGDSKISSGPEPGSSKRKGWQPADGWPAP